MNDSDKFLIGEIFQSIQGEGTHVGIPMLFVRLSGCNLKCIYCDTPIAQKIGDEYSLSEILEKINSVKNVPVYITGGEPLIQYGTPLLIDELIKMGRDVFIDTNGTLDISNINSKARKIVDIKTPGSVAGGKFLENNLKHINVFDEIKFVVTSKDDFIWAVAITRTWGLFELTPNILVQPSWGVVEPRDLVKWILDSQMPLHLSLQIHKYIWEPGTQGV